MVTLEILVSLARSHGTFKPWSGLVTCVHTEDEMGAVMKISVNIYYVLYWFLVIARKYSSKTLSCEHLVQTYAF